MKANRQMVRRRDIFQNFAAWDEIRTTATERGKKAMNHGHLTELLLYTINLILLALIVYGMYYGLQNSATRGF